MSSINNIDTNHFETWELPAEINTNSLLWTYLKEEHDKAFAKLGDLVRNCFNDQMTAGKNRQQYDEFVKEGRDFLNRAIEAFDARRQHRDNICWTISKSMIEIAKVYLYDPKTGTFFPYPEETEDEVDLYCDWISKFYLEHEDPASVLRIKPDEESIRDLVKNAKRTFPNHEKLDLIWKSVKKYTQTDEYFFKKQQQFALDYLIFNSHQLRRTLFHNYFLEMLANGHVCDLSNSFYISAHLNQVFVGEHQLLGGELDDLMKEASVLAIKVFVEEAVKRRVSDVVKQIVRISEFGRLSNCTLKKEDKLMGIQIGLDELVKHNWNFGVFDQKRETGLQFVKDEIQDLEDLLKTSLEQIKTKLERKNGCTYFLSPEELRSRLGIAKGNYQAALPMLQEAAEKSKNLFPRRTPNRYFPAEFVGEE